MVETKENEFEQLSDAEVEALWKEAFAGTKLSELPSDFTIEMKRAVLEIRRHEIARLTDAEIDILWEKTVSDKTVPDTISEFKSSILELIQGSPRMLARTKKYIDEYKPLAPRKPIYAHDIVKGTYRLA